MFNEKKKRKVRPLSAEILFFAVCLAVIPSLFVYEAISFFDRGNYLQRSEEHRQQVLKMVKISANFFHEENFWNNYFNISFRDSGGPLQFAEMIRDSRLLGGKIPQFIIWNTRGKIVAENLTVKTKRLGDWQKVPDDLGLIFKRSGAARSSALVRLRKIFGNQFYVTNSKRNSAEFIHPEIKRFDIDPGKPRIWLARDKNKLAILFLDNHFFAQKAGYKSFVRTWKAENGVYALLRRQQIIGGHGELSDFDLKVVGSDLRGSSTGVVQSGDRVFGLVRINQNFEMIIGSQRIVSSATGKKFWMFLLLAVFLLCVHLRNFNYESLSFARASVKNQLLILLFILAGLPAVFLIVPTIGYLAQKRVALMNEKTQEMIDFLQLVDRSSRNQYSRFLNIIEKLGQSLRHLLSQDYTALELSNAFEVGLAQKGGYNNFLLVDSDRDTIYERYNYFNNNQVFASRPSSKPYDFKKDELETLKGLGKYIIAMFNREAGKFEPGTEQSYIFEMFFQQTMEMFINNLLQEREIITEIGWGSTPLKIFTQVISRVEESRKNFFLMISFFRETLEHRFLKDNQQQINRNDNYIRFFATMQTSFFPNDFADMPERDLLVGMVSSYPSTKPIQVRVAGKDFLYAGLRGHFLLSSNLIALFPLERIDAQIAAETASLMLSSLIAAMIIVSLTFLFYFSLIFPIRQLHQATVALEERDFKFRLGRITNDEFGEMAEIFDASMADLEELELAKMVQTRLFPKDVLKNERFAVYGYSLPMAQLGGDYFDYFAAEEDCLCVLLGDVAGHGVGAALIMAMAKAGVLYSLNNASNPAEMLHGLHQMILRTRDKEQRKIMTFQFLSLNIQTGKALYANAGGCSPLLVDMKAGTMVEIEQFAPVLGGFKKSKFANIDLELHSGQAMIFYTDGIIESRNEQNQELGYERFQQLVLASRSDDVEEYYQNIMAGFTQWVGKARIPDDITLVVLRIV